MKVTFCLFAALAAALPQQRYPMGNSTSDPQAQSTGLYRQRNSTSRAQAILAEASNITSTIHITRTVFRTETVYAPSATHIDATASSSQTVSASSLERANTARLSGQVVLATSLTQASVTASSRETAQATSAQTAIASYVTQDTEASQSNAQIDDGIWAILPQPAGIPNPNNSIIPKVARSDFTVPQTFINESGDAIMFQADLGFSGVLSGRSFWVYGDTFVDGFPAAVDTCGIGHLNNLSLITLNSYKPGGYINQLIPDTANETAGLVNRTEFNYGFGGTNVVETRLGTGIIYYYKILRSATTTQVIGAGLAELTLQPNGTLANTTRNGETMWTATEPAWGDIGATKDATHLYLWGHGPGDLGEYGYMARVILGDELDVDQYEYWNNATQTWGAQRLGDGTQGTVQITPDMAIWGNRQMFQAAPFWNAHYGLWLWIYGSNTLNSNVLLASATSLQGPWTKHGIVASSVSPFQGNTTGLLYGINGHPEYDLSGRTTYVTWVVNNLVLGTILTWE